MRPRTRLRSALLVGLLLLGTGLATGCQSPSEETPRGAEEQATTASSVPDSVRHPPDSATAARFRAAMDGALSHEGNTESLGLLMQKIGLQFEGRPYLEGTLDEPATETLVVRLDGFDCVTFVETTLAIARTARASDSSYAAFARRLAEQRYRNGRLDGYCSRLHYFTEWLSANADRGVVRLLGEELGGRVLRDTLDFMSTHRSAYERFATNDSLFACVQAMEARLRDRQSDNPVYYVPQDSIRAVYDQLHAGDIVGLVTSIDGLDVAHAGLVYTQKDGGRGLLHASLSDGVVVSPDIQRYVEKIDRQIGMVVARPQPVP